MKVEFGILGDEEMLIIANQADLPPAEVAKLLERSDDDKGITPAEALTLIEESFRNKRLVQLLGVVACDEYEVDLVIEDVDPIKETLSLAEKINRRQVADIYTVTNTITPHLSQTNDHLVFSIMRLMPIETVYDWH